MKIKNFVKTIEIPEGLIVSIDKSIVTITNKDKKISKPLKHKKVDVIVKDNKINISFKNGTKKEKMIAGTFIAHIKNMLKGITEGHLYKLKICSGHFPMNVTLKEDKIIINNFLGEKTPRELKIKNDADVKIEGDLIIVEGANKDIVSQTAADIELLTKIKGKDLRIFQDGCYIIMKDGKDIN